MSDNAYGQPTNETNIDKTNLDVAKGKEIARIAVPNNTNSDISRVIT